MPLSLYLPYLIVLDASSQIRCRSLCVRRRPTGPRHGKGGPNGRQRAPAFALIPTDARLGGFGLEVWGASKATKNSRGESERGKFCT